MVPFEGDLSEEGRKQGHRLKGRKRTFCDGDHSSKMNSGQ
jgi:hypothetical protein